MMKYLHTLLLILIPISGYAQVKHKKPVISKTQTFSAEEARSYARRNELSNKSNLTGAEGQELTVLFEKYEEVFENMWDAVGGGCNWYEAAKEKKLIASSFLESTGTTNYKVENIHDLSFYSVWSEGVVGYGIGEYVEYHFRPDHPRITQVNIANGYVRSDKQWKENSRVKSLKMFVNGKLYAILDLSDIKAVQSFDFSPIGRNNKGKDWTLRFEIADVYKGDKYDDTVISELFFDGTDVH